jgi:CheY-like chemotaxis protein
VGLPAATGREFWVPGMNALDNAPAGRILLPVPGVLIIEDHEDSADLLREIIEMMFSDLEVRVAYSGAAGIEQARRSCPSIVLCDLDLPDMDGYAVARSLRSVQATAGSRLVAYSGFSHEDDRARSREAGFDLHLTKPVEPEILERLLTETRREARP